MFCICGCGAFDSMSSLSLDTSSLAPLKRRLAEHPVYDRVQDLASLRVLMSHHIYAVWDFMSLLKTLQGLVAPTTVPWVPRGDAALRRFINEIVTEEECDRAMGKSEGYLSHFELYVQAMREVGADPEPALAVVAAAAREGIEAALAHPRLPTPAREFMRTTFGFIATAKPHVVAAAFSLGREDVIPTMFRAMLARLGVGREEAPAFHYYLERHVHLDEGTHAPLALLLLERLCEGRPESKAEALDAARRALEARIRFWDGVAEAISSELARMPLLVRAQS